VNLKFLTVVCVAFLSTAFLVGGCIFDSSKKISGTDSQVTVPDLEEEFGGYTSTDEAPGFGDPEILNDFEEDQDVVDLLSTDPKIAEYMEDSLVEVYFLRITWGRLDLDTTVTTVTDWSGLAQIDKGILVLLKTLCFDEGDYIHYPRPDSQTLEWTSYTGPHFDGIYVAIVVPPDDSSGVAGAFNFSTAPFSITLNYSELDSIDVVYPVGQDGDEICFVGYKKQLAPCGNGFMEGRWIRTRRHQGEARGKWISRDGSLSGHFEGTWGRKNNGEQMFFGKCIGPTGDFKWLIRAKWEYSHYFGEDGGRFIGEWYDQNGEAQGTLGGHFRVGGQQGKKGSMQGQWKSLCQ
jgi:hypothetical protein